MFAFFFFIEYNEGLAMFKLSLSVFCVLTHRLKPGRVKRLLDL